MYNWTKPHEPHGGPHAPPPPPHPAHFRNGRPPHEHIYDACEAILANQQELALQIEELNRKLADLVSSRNSV